MTSKAMWMVRAGEGGLLVDDFRAESIVGIGWVKLGDMTALVTRADFTRAVAQAYPNDKAGQKASAAGQTYPLAPPFFVLATQNPIELEGTYPLPEAQLDRFMFKLTVPFPARDTLLQLLDVSLDAEPADTLQAIADAAEVRHITQLCRHVLVGERCRHAAVDLVVATQLARDGAAADARRHIRYGASPRALQALVRAARVRALLAGRPHVDVADLDAVALPVLRHRVLLRLESELDGLDADGTLGSIVDAWRRRL